ncbi:MAG: SGNH/GDSL hydrolase family protein [Alicyclobacillus sp.]|nr:SGNH/GDSL hydrolase family protein [Alicyclobacillus sp.]
MPREIYLALGDSITAGYNASHPQSTYVWHVLQHARSCGLAHRGRVLARHLWTARDLWRAALQLPGELWSATRLVTVLIGGNDLRRLLRRYYLPAPVGGDITPSHVERCLDAFQPTLAELCAYVTDWQIPYRVLCTVYNPAPHSDLACFALHRLNQIIRAVAQREGWAVAEVAAAFAGHEAVWIDGYRNGRLEDLVVPWRRPIHPNNAGHGGIARAIRQVLPARRRTTPKSARQGHAVYNRGAGGRQ